MSEASVIKEVKVDFVGVGFFNNLHLKQGTIGHLSEVFDGFRDK